MVLLDTHQENHTYSEFEAKIKILHHTSISFMGGASTASASPAVTAGYVKKGAVGEEPRFC